ncbi:MAG: tetratricopeptide repeat protein, partial [Stellaceae bacterium]
MTSTFVPYLTSDFTPIIDPHGAVLGSGDTLGVGARRISSGVLASGTAESTTVNSGGEFEVDAGGTTTGISPSPVAEAIALGEARYRAGAYGEAAAIFSRIREQMPDHPDALRLLGLCRLRLGEPAAGLELLGKARALAPADPFAQLHYGLGLHAVGRHAEAAAQFRACAPQLPEDPVPYLNLASALLALGETSTALDAARRARRRAR